MHFSVIQSLAHVFQLPVKNALSPFQYALARTTHRLPVCWQQCSSFTSTVPVSARGGKGQPKVDQRITLIRYFLQHPLTPRPLRLSRLRSLRYWTIHRAWQLYQHKLRATERLELQRQYMSMRDACEELRVGCADEGKLYRQAMVKKGIYGGLGADKGREGGIPIEYARAQTDGPPRDGWDHNWKR